MKIPTEIVTKHKIRDAKICLLYAKDSFSMEEIALRFKISAPRVHQIIWKNRHLMKVDREYEKIKRINKLKRILNKQSEFIVNKDAVDVIKEIRAETEGRAEGSGGGGETKIIIIREGAKEDGRVETVPQGISRSFSV